MTKQRNATIQYYTDPNGHYIPLRCPHDVVLADACSICQSIDPRWVAQFLSPPKTTPNLPVAPEPEDGITEGPVVDTDEDSEDTNAEPDEEPEYESELEEI